MNRRILKLAAVLLSCCMLFASCSGRTEDGADKQEINATGRYLEEKVNFPGLVNVYALQQVAPDTYYVLGQQEGDPPGAWRSEDGGVTWRTSGHADLSGLEILSGAFTPDGNFYISFADVSDPENVTFQCAYVDEDTITVIQDIPELTEYITGMALTKSGDLLIDNAFSFTQVNPETGKATRYDLNEGQTFSGNYVVYGDKLAVCEATQVTVFDTATGDTDTVKLPTETGMGTALAVQEDGSGFFYCNHDGLYRITMDGAITEQLIDGSLAGFGMPSVTMTKLLACRDGSFLVLCVEQGAWQMQRYVFEPDIARKPSRELTVFSLWDDAYIRQVIGLYQREYPDVMVRLQIGLSDNSAVTAGDAIRALSTELLADKGPDVFVLDGLPVDSYIQKGVLADLTPSLEDVENDLLPNVVLGQGGCIIPSAILGVNASGKQAEASLDFVRFALKAEIQKSSFYNNGMPVNRTALEIIAGSEKPGVTVGSGGSTYNDSGESYSLESCWPTDEQMQGMLEMIASAETATPHNEIIRQMILDETADLFAGNRTVEDVVQSLSQKIERYLQE